MAPKIVASVARIELAESGVHPRNPFDGAIDKATGNTTLHTRTRYAAPTRPAMTSPYPRDRSLMGQDDTSIYPNDVV
jgi:hypothetical protein